MMPSGPPDSSLWRAGWISSAPRSGSSSGTGWPRHQSKGQVALRGIFRDQFLNGGGLRLSRCSTSRQVAAILPHRSGCKFCRLLFGIPGLPAAALDILLVDDTRAHHPKLPLFPVRYPLIPAIELASPLLPRRTRGQWQLYLSPALCLPILAPSLLPS